MKNKFKDKRTYFIGIYSILSLGIIVQLFIAKMIPMKFKLIGTVVLLILFFGMFYLQYGRKTNKVNRILGKIIIIILSVLLVFGNLYLNKTYRTLDHIAGDNVKAVEVSVVVMKDSEYENLEDLTDKMFGTISIGELRYTEKAVKDIEKDLKQSIVIAESNDYDTFARSLYNGEVDAVILNDGYRGMFEGDYASFDEDTRIIKTFTYYEKVKSFSKSVKVDEDTFLMYITGIDTYGSISTVSRSDVNKVMAINPRTRQILLIDIPRDYYVPQVCQGNQTDKLTHTGLWGAECTVQSVSNYIDEDINYYMRVNFSSLVNIVDALGGITVNSDYAFGIGGYFFQVGENHLDGEGALAFSRERKSLEGGDNARIKNQSKVLSAIIRKATSPSIITNYMGVMDAISGTFQTNLSDSELSSLINMQLNNMSSWNITEYAVKGFAADDWSPANGKNAWVMYPDEKTVTIAKQLIEQLRNDEIPAAPNN